MDRCKLSVRPSAYSTSHPIKVDLNTTPEVIETISLLFAYLFVNFVQLCLKKKNYV
jgi:hypothetical protein